jgi:hypothetical protein
MKQYKVKFIFEDKSSELNFESNEKPIKGDLFTVQETDGKSNEVKIKEVTKVVVRGLESSATIEYHCAVEKYDSKSPVIGFAR